MQPHMGARTDVLFGTLCAEWLSEDSDRLVLEFANGGDDHCYSYGAAQCPFPAVVFRSAALDGGSCDGSDALVRAAPRSHLAFGVSARFASELVHHVRRSDGAYPGKPTTGFHAVATMALACGEVELYGFSGSTTIDGHVMTADHNIEAEHGALRRLIEHTLPDGDYPSEQTRIEWSRTRIRHAGEDWPSSARHPPPPPAPPPPPTPPPPPPWIEPCRDQPMPFKYCTSSRVANCATDPAAQVHCRQSCGLCPPPPPPPMANVPPPPPPPVAVPAYCNERRVVGHGARWCSDGGILGSGGCDDFLLPADRDNYGHMGSFYLCTSRASGCEEVGPVSCPERTAGELLAYAGVTAEEWQQYVVELYNADASAVASLPTIRDVELVYTGLLPLQRVDSRELDGSGSCPGGGLLAPYRQHQPHPPYAAFYRRVAPVEPIASGSWVEVTHCSHEFEAGGAWFYVLPGSAVYVRVGRTIAFTDHDEAAAHFLSAEMATAEYREAHRERDIELLPRAAAAAGYDSIQFLQHCDLSCNRCAHEVLLVSTNGRDAGCPPGVEFRTGWQASLPCECTTVRGSVRDGVTQWCVACESFPPSILAG